MRDVPGSDKQHNFLTVIEAMWADGRLPRTAGYHHCHIAHDDWCGFLCGQRCNCQPEVSLAWSLAGESAN